MNFFESWTAKEAYDYATDLFQQHMGGAPDRRMRSAILTTYRDLPNRHPWRYYYRVATFATDVSYSDGQITYDSDTRIVTLADGTFPASTELWVIKIQEVIYRIESRLSDTEVVLSQDSAPSQDISTGEDYVLYRAYYLLPVNFRIAVSVWDEFNERELTQINFSQQEQGNIRFWGVPSAPHSYTMEVHPKYPGRNLIRLMPFAETSRTIRVLYYSSPRPISLTFYQGVGTIDPLEPTKFTLVEPTSVPDSRVGSMIWISSTQEPPTSEIGGYNPQTGKDALNPFSQQAIITAIDDSELTLSQELDGDGSFGFLITDVLDIDNPVMQTLFQSMLELEIVKQLHQTEHIRPKYEAMRKAFDWAREAEQRVENSTHDYSLALFYTNRLRGDATEVS